MLPGSSFMTMIRFKGPVSMTVVRLIALTGITEQQLKVSVAASHVPGHV